MGLSKQELIDVYQDTIKQTKTLKQPITKKITFDDIKKSDGKPKIRVFEYDTVSSLEMYPENTCILNMASSKHPGGGVERGASAQEEALFRCSNLHTISKSFYPLGENEALYSHDVSFIKNVYYGWMHLKVCDVITIAAPNLNYGGLSKNYTSTPEYIELIKNKMRLMLSTNKENLILGAWGCGVFKNDPRVIATLFKEVVEEGTNIKNIAFGVINDRNSVDNNYSIFKEILL